MRLTELPSAAPAVVEARRGAGRPTTRSRAACASSASSPAKPVEVVAAGPLGAEPLLVQVGFTRFALRRSEAARVRLRASGGAA